VNTVRVLTVDWWTFPFVALILTLLTSGRLQRGVDRLLVAAYALPLVLGQLLWMMFDSTQGAAEHREPPADRCPILTRRDHGRQACCDGFL
jgi:hypothetical protein